MKEPLISRESVKLMFELGIEVLKSLKGIYLTKTDERSLNNDTPQDTIGNNSKDSNSSDRNIDP